MRRLGNLYGATGGGFAGMVYDSNEKAPALNCCQGGETTAYYGNNCAGQLYAI